MKITNKLALMNRLIDNRIDLFGVRNTISYFLDLGLSRTDLLDLCFDEEDVDFVIANPDEEYDCE